MISQVSSILASQSLKDNKLTKSSILSHGFMSPSAPVENAYHVMSEVRYECHAGFVMKGGADSLKCHATGCWMPNELPTCVRQVLNMIQCLSDNMTPFLLGQFFVQTICHINRRFQYNMRVKLGISKTVTLSDCSIHRCHIIRQTL